MNTKNAVLLLALVELVARDRSSRTPACPVVPVALCLPGVPMPTESPSLLMQIISGLHSDAARVNQLQE